MTTPSDDPRRPPDRIVVAAAQYPIERLASLAALKAKHARWVADAAAAGADLLVFPEYGLMEIAGTRDDRTAGDLNASLAAVADGRAEIDAHFETLARRHQLHILTPSGPARRGDGGIANRALLASPDGKSGNAEKHIMTPFEHRWGVTGGGPVQVFETSLGRIGVLVCYDCEFPLLARAMTEAGARLLLVPTCTERVSGFHRVRTGALARALESTVAAVVSPTVGDAPWSPAVDRNAGAAAIVVPAEAGVSDTGILAEGRFNAPQLVTAEIDFSRLAELRGSGEMRNFADWSLQPGAGPRLPAVSVVCLRG